MSTPRVAGSSGALPPGMTIEGDYSYNSGAVSGSVSAASNKYHWIIAADVAGTLSNSATKLVITWIASIITWIASSSLHVP
jgi:hypothetical protein